jgi:O-antigen/teichoic acid export membrane protein
MTTGAVGARDQARLLKGAGVNLIGAIGKFLTPAYLILANQIFGPAAFGLYALTLAPLEMLNNFVVAGFKDAVERFAARDPDETEATDGIYAVIWRCLVWVLGMSCLAVLALAALGRPLVELAWHRPELYDVLLLFTANIPLVGLMIILLSAARALMIMHPEVIVSSFVVPVTLIVVAFALHPLVPSVYGLVLAYTAANLVGVVLAAFYFTRYYSLRRLWAARKLASPEKLVRFALPQSVNMMLTLATWNLDVMMLGSFVGDAQIGFYRTAAEIARSLTQLRFIFSGVYSPLVARYAREKNVAAMQESFSVISRWVLAVAAPLTVLVYLYRAEILWIFNPAYHLPATFIALLLIGPLFNAATGLTGNILVMAGFPVYNLMNGILLTVINGCLNYFLIPRWGLAGAAFATMVAQLGVGILQIIEVRWLVGVTVEWLKLARPTAGAALSGLAALGVHQLALPWPAVTIVGQGVVAVGVYLAVMFAPFGERMTFSRPTMAPRPPSDT